jgi:bacillithiol biosynthesis cysteine-adding enzyme BshC
MEPTCVRHNTIPGTSRLFLDYLYNFDRVDRFYGGEGWDAEHVLGAARGVRYPKERRKQLVAALREQNGDSAALEKLAQPDTVAIVTGQQVGFLSGPAYTVFKALTAVKLAAHLTEQGIPAVPIFWLATEDHDLAEVDHAWVFNSEATPAKISIANTVVNGGPVGDVVLNEIPLADLKAALGGLPFAEEAIEAVKAAYQPGKTLGAAFRNLIENILRGCGLLFLDPLAPAIRELAAPFLRDTVERVPELLDALHRRNTELEAAGYHTQVFVDKDSSLLFLLDQGRRTAIRWSGEQFQVRDRSYSPADLKALAAQLSPNALLRPVMQDYLLPTATYVGGPAEIAYFAQGHVLYDNLLGRMPVIYPRNGFTLLDARAAKLLERHGLRVPDLLDYEDKVKSRLAVKLVPENLAAKLAGVDSAISDALARLQSDLHRFDPTLEAAAKKTAAKVHYQLAKLSRKTARETLRRDERATKDAAYLTNLIYPHRHLQERFYSILPFLAQHGFDLPQRLLEQVQLSCADHMVRTV